MSILDTISQSPAAARGREMASKLALSSASAAARGREVAWKLARSTGKAAWLAGTTLLVLGLPLIIAMDREQQLEQSISEYEAQQSILLGAPVTA
ncbi:hypothetical protein ACP70R_003741 [Stipagrostis hirtigluma subsp. patula]